MILPLLREGPLAIVITGSEGNVGRRLLRAFPGAVGIDVREGAAIVADLATADFSRAPLATALAAADAVIHLAANANPQAPAAAHMEAAATAARVFAACAAVNVPRLVVASSNWAEPVNGQPINAYGFSKRVVEELAALYSQLPGLTAVALRVGWVPRAGVDVASASEWLARNYWDDTRLVAEFRAALDF